MSMRKLLVKNTFWLALLEAISKIIMFGVTVSLVRYLGPSQFGTFNLAFSYVAMFMILSDFGLNTITTRDVSKDRHQTENYLGNLLGIKLFLSVIISILIILSLFISPPSGTKSIILLVLIYNLGQNIGSAFISIFNAWEQMELVFFTRLTYYLGILLSALIVINLHGSTSHIVIAYGLSTITSIILSIYLIKKNGIKINILFDKTFWQKMFIETIPFMGLAIVSALYANNDTLLIGKYLGSTQVGFYQSAYKILFAFQSINVINSAIFPRLNVLIHQNNSEILAKLIKIVIVLSILGLIPLAIVITIFQSKIISIVYGLDYIFSAPVMVILIWSGVVNYFRIFVSNLLFIRNKQNQVFYSVTTGLLINVIINLIFIPQFGIISAAWSMMVSEIIILIFVIKYVIYEK